MEKDLDPGTISFLAMDVKGTSISKEEMALWKADSSPHQRFTLCKNIKVMQSVKI